MPLNKYLVDSNILIRHLTQDSAALSPVATKYMERIANNEALAFITSLIVHEVIYVLVYVYKVRRKELVKSLKKLLQLENLEVLDINKESLVRALDDFAKYNVDFPDCVFNQISLNERMEILTFDEDFKRLEALLKGEEDGS
ncbi:PIN domain-containing protein [candidate division WWE3 bacterium]|nr:PIN domain-containing protein [candidate division WWE3 bacterium]